MSADFSPCEVCGAIDWQEVYRGPVRHGAFGNERPDGAVCRCDGCGAERLAETACVAAELYEDEAYRRILDEPTEAEGFFATHDALQLRHWTAAEPVVLRGRVVADIGCGAGSFLDHVAGLARETIAVEPCTTYHASLAERGHKVHADLDDAVAARAGAVDVAFSFATIEHVPDPRGFLEAAGRLLAPDGLLVVSTPNRDDILCGLLGDDYKRFFYRTVHRWYFDAGSLGECAARAGLAADRIDTRHRFGLDNALRWLRDRAPGGRDALPGLGDATLDAVWRTHLERTGAGDFLYARFRRNERPAP